MNWIDIMCLNPRNSPHCLESTVLCAGECWVNSVVVSLCSLHAPPSSTQCDAPHPLSENQLTIQDALFPQSCAFLFMSGFLLRVVIPVYICTNVLHSTNVDLDDTVGPVSPGLPFWWLCWIMLPTPVS